MFYLHCHFWPFVSCQMFNRGRDSDHNRRNDTARKNNDKGQAHRSTVSKNKNSSVKTSPKSAGKVDEGKSKEDKNQLSETSTDKDTVIKSEIEER